MVNDAYKVLGLTPDASQPEIKSAYRKLALQYHPDRNQTEKAQKMIKEVNAAYSILSDPRTKREHDAHLHMGNNQNFNPNSFFDQFFNSGPLRGFDDLFSHTSRQSNMNEYAASHTLVRSEMTIMLEEVNTGANRRFRINEKDFDIHIPPGIQHGETVSIILDNMFELNVLVKIANHNIFDRRDGIDIYTRIDVPLRIAIAGGDIRAPIIDGEISLTIPKGTSSHTKLRVSGGGLMGGNRRGNAYYEVKIKVPRLHSGVDVVIQQLLENQSDE